MERTLTPAATDEHRHRLAAAAAAAADVGLGALLVAPGPDLRYLVGYEAIPLERLTCLVVPADGVPRLVVPRLEAPAAAASAAGPLEVEVVPWDETDDPFRLVADLVGPVAAVGVTDRMRADHVLALRGAMPGAEQRLATDALGPLRRRKSPAEVAALREAADAIDAVHAAMGSWLRVGRRETEVARDIAAAILDAGHASVDFVIVAGGPNSASPHHEPGARVLQAGDSVVVDIGGTTPAGYCSDSTRTYQLGEPDPTFLASYAVLETAQAAACAAVRPGVSAESVDATARQIITDAGDGERFVHRTGHGIGVETHEQPYVVQGNTLPLAAGMAFSVEPGIYHPGRFGARIEDIVVVTETGVDVLNRRPRALAVLP
jgi:Xaa-Pro aminopeptidase